MYWFISGREIPFFIQENADDVRGEDAEGCVWAQDGRRKRKIEKTIR